MPEFVPHYAMFIDLMGFADGLESLSEQDGRMLVESIAEDYQPEMCAEAKRLFVRYREFHEYLDDAVSKSGLELSLSVSFSDSGFVAAERREPILECAENIVQKCYSRKIPVRAGIGRGTVGRAIFSNSSTRHFLLAQSQFFGTAVVRAYRAFERGPKGFRVLIHPSAETAADFEDQWRLPLVEQDERSVACVRELNFLPREKRSYGSNWAMCRNSLDAMREGVTSENALLHYTASERALDRLERMWRQHFPEEDGPIRVGRKLE